MFTRKIYHRKEERKFEQTNFAQGIVQVSSSSSKQIVNKTVAFEIKGQNMSHFIMSVRKNLFFWPQNNADIVMRGFKSSTTKRFAALQIKGFAECSSICL